MENRKTQITQQFLNNSFLNYVPVICSIMVIIIHQYNIPANMEKNTVAFFIERLFSHGLATAAVPTFFFISGFLFFANAETINDVVKKQKRRVLSVLVPFLAWSALYTVFYAVAVQLISSMNTRFEYTFSWVIQSIVFYKYSFFLWYMFQLCIYVLISPITFAVLKNKRISIFLLLILIVVGAFIRPDIKIVVLGDERSLFCFNFFAYYFAGCFLSKMPKACFMLKKCICRIPTYIYILFFVAFSFFESCLFSEIIRSFNKRILVPFVFITFLFMMIKICENFQEVKPSYVSTMVIYGIHSLIGLVLGFIVMGRIGLPLLVKYFACIILVTALSFFAGYIMKKIPIIYRIFSGNR